MPHGLKSIFRNASYILGGRFLSIISRLIYVVTLARVLGTEGYGLFNYGLSWYLIFVPFAALGQEEILSREIGQNKEAAASMVLSGFLLRLVAAGGFCLVCGGIGYALSNDELSRNLILIFSSTLVARSLSTWTEGVIVAFERGKYALYLESIFRLSEVALGIALICSGYGIIALASLHALTWWVRALSGIIVVHTKLVKFSNRPHLMAIKLLLSQGAFIGITKITSRWYFAGPVVLFRHLSNDLHALGLLAFCCQILNYMVIIPNVVAYTSLPILSRAVFRDDGKEQLFVKCHLLFTLLIAVLAAFLAETLGSVVVPLIMGVQYQDVIPVLSTVVWLVVPLAFSGCMEKVFIARGKVSILIFPSAIGAIIMTLIILRTVDSFGFAGAVLGLAVGLTARAGWLCWLSKSDRPAYAGAILGSGAVSVAAYFCNSMVTIDHPLMRFSLYLFLLISIIGGYRIFFGSVQSPPAIEGAEKSK